MHIRDGYPPERIEEIRRLATERTDAEIAEVLNQRGQTSSRGQLFTAKMIAWIRWKYRIPTIVLQRQPKEMTVSEVASEFGVAKNVVHYWIQRGVLPARQLGANRPYWITLSEHKEQELRAWVQASRRINRKPNQESSVELSSTPIEGGAL